MIIVYLIGDPKPSRIMGSPKTLGSNNR